MYTTKDNCFYRNVSVYQKIKRRQIPEDSNLNIHDREKFEICIFLNTE
jgi:hypothetical protein